MAAHTKDCPVSYNSPYDPVSLKIKQGLLSAQELRTSVAIDAPKWLTNTDIEVIVNAAQDSLIAQMRLVLAGSRSTRYYSHPKNALHAILAFLGLPHARIQIPQEIIKVCPHSRHKYEVGEAIHFRWCDKSNDTGIPEQIERVESTEMPGN